MRPHDLLPPEDKLGLAADTLKWELVTLLGLLVTLYLLRSTVLDARVELEAARVRAAKAENDLEGALATITDVKQRHGITDDDPDE